MSDAPVPSDLQKIETPGTPAAVDQIEREKFEFERNIRLKEIELKEAEAMRLAEELKIKQRDSERSRWTNPFVVAIIGATAVGICSGAVSVLNAKYQRDLADTTNQNQGYLESVRAENANILEVVKLGDPDKVRSGLCLLIKLNSIKSSATNAGIQSYLVEHQGCLAEAGQKPPAPIGSPTPLTTRADWVTATLVVPGCGNSGCYQNFSVCGSAPANTKTTGNIRNSVDSFGGAWGDWNGPPAVTPTQVCRTFTQHSHNVTRTVSFQFEVVPTS
jgi:hypothetical protein